MIKIGQHYQAGKSLVNVEVIAINSERHPGGKRILVLKGHTKDEDGNSPDDAHIDEKYFKEEIASGRWTLSHDPDEPLPEVQAPRNRLGDID